MYKKDLDKSSLLECIGIVYIVGGSLFGTNVVLCMTSIGLSCLPTYVHVLQDCVTPCLTKYARTLLLRTTIIPNSPTLLVKLDNYILLVAIQWYSLRPCIACTTTSTLNQMMMTRQTEKRKMKEVPKLDNDTLMELKGKRRRKDEIIGQSVLSVV